MLHNHKLLGFEVLPGQTIDSFVLELTLILKQQPVSEESPNDYGSNKCLMPGFVLKLWACWLCSRNRRAHAELFAPGGCHKNAEGGRQLESHHRREI